MRRKRLDASRLSPLASRLSPLASRLSPLASRLSPLASRLSPPVSRAGVTSEPPKLETTELLEAGTEGNSQGGDSENTHYTSASVYTMGPGAPRSRWSCDGRCGSPVTSTLNR
ncbi:hypothetical protein EYF80_010777 [Liparis tanakae]|uniref:Uncharacterized protein n=1 Tax=Liparis tanakae TaxID=230148 RepID=A0A4Z2IN10_9TELE|nr:hypothetical protein EYF80_010777 [Liparis tanakae]